MLNKSLILCLCFLFFQIDVFAETLPKGSKSDVRIKTYKFDDNAVYRLDVHIGYVTSIEFEANETVQSMVIGDPDSWEIVRLSRGDIVTVKPLDALKHTNMTVITNERIYTFEMRSLETVLSRAAQNYRLKFDYGKKHIKQYTSGSFQQVSDKDVKEGFVAIARHTDYRMSRKMSIIKPVQVFDDGDTTFIHMNKSTQRPAVYIADSKGRERIVNSFQHGDHIAINRISKRWVLRYGNEVVCIERF